MKRLLANLKEVMLILLSYAAALIAIGALVVVADFAVKRWKGKAGNVIAAVIILWLLTSAVVVVSSAIKNGVSYERDLPEYDDYPRAR